jgi:uncharacterized repeat protein (TIGR01451 family)
VLAGVVKHKSIETILAQYGSLNFKGYVMSKCNLRLLVAACLLSFGSMAAYADNVTPIATAKPAKTVEAKLAAFKVTQDANKKEVLAPADKVAPGDLLEYQVVYQNNGKSQLKQLTATLPLPVGMTYVAGSAKPASAMASLDGKTFAAMPLKRMVKKADGKLEEQAIPLSEYRALRWKLGELAEKGKAEVSALAHVNQVLVSSLASK